MAYPATRRPRGDTALLRYGIEQREALTRCANQHEQLPLTILPPPPVNHRPRRDSGRSECSIRQRDSIVSKELESEKNQIECRSITAEPTDALPNGPPSIPSGSVYSTRPPSQSTNDPGSTHVPDSQQSTAPSSSNLCLNGRDKPRIFFPLSHEDENSLDLRLPTPRLDQLPSPRGFDSSFSFESLGSQAGSRQSLIESGKCPASKQDPASQLTSGLIGENNHTRGNAASEMDLTRRQREARKKDIRNKLRLEKLDGDFPSNERRWCRWTFVFDPSGRLIYYWSAIVSLAFLYNFWVIIYRYSFQEIESSTMLIWFSLDYFTDLIYLTDILFHFRTGYLEDGVLQTDGVKLRQHYMNSTTFYIDALCLLPLDFLYLSLGFMSFLRVFRLVKIYRFWEFIDRTERHTNYPNLFRSTCLIHYLLVAFHWNACVFFLLHKKEGFGPGGGNVFGDILKKRVDVMNEERQVNRRTEHQMNSLEEEEGEDIVMLYLISYYWTIQAMTTVGNLPHPSKRGQFIYVIFQLFIGLITFATVLGYIANIVTNVSADRRDFQAKLDGVKIYMRLRKVPTNIQIKVIKWFDYLWLNEKSMDDEKTVSCLPDKLKGEIAIHVHLDTLKRVEIFQNTDGGFLCELVLRLRPVLFSPGDYICRKGEVGKEMYICSRGRLQVVVDEGKTVLATLKAGSYFGEISILNMGTAGNRRTASVRSVGYSDLFVLSKTDMWDVLKDYPAARVRLEAIAAKRLEKYKKAPLENAAMARSQSTPGLLESHGQVALEDMWVSPLPLTPPTGSPDSQHSMHRDSPISANVSRTQSRIETERKNRVEIVKSPRSQRVKRQGDKSSLTSRDSSDCASMLRGPAYLGTSHQPHTLQVIAPTPSIENSPCSQEHLSICSSYSIGDHGTPASTQYLQISHHRSPAGSSLGSAGLGDNLRPRSDSPASNLPARTGLPAIPHGAPLVNKAGKATNHNQQQPEELIMEIKRLRDRLKTLETENASMSRKMSQSQKTVNQRLNDIEMQICCDSTEREDSLSVEEEKVEEESFI